MAGNDDVSVRFGADASDLSSGVDQAKGKIAEIGDAAEGIKGTLGDLAAAFGTVFAVDKLEEFSAEMANLGLQIENMTHLTGMSVDQVQNFQDSIQILGGSSELAGTTLVRLERNMADAASGVGNAGQAFQRLGVSMDALKSGNVNEVLAQMADRMYDTSDGANKTGAAMEAMGRGGYSLIPILDQGGEGFKKLTAAIDEAKVKLSPELAESFSESAVGMNILHQSVEGLHEAIYAQLEPSLDAVVGALTNFDEESQKSVSSGSALAQLIQYFGAVIDGVVAAVNTLTVAFIQLFDIARGGVKSIADEMRGLGDLMYDTATGQFKRAAEEWAAAQAKAVNDIKQGFKEAGDAGQQYLNDMKRMMDIYTGTASVSPIKLGNTQGSGQIGGPPGKDTKDDSEKYRQLQAEKYDVAKSYDDLEVQSGRMSRQQEIADLQAALAFEKALVDDSFNQQMAHYATDSAEYKKLTDEKAIADEKFIVEHNKLTLQATQVDAKAWTQAFNSIEKAFDTMLTGVLQGTQTIGQTFQKMAGNLVITFASAIGEMLLKWSAFQAATALGFTQMAQGIGGSGGGSGIMGQLTSALLSLVGIELVSNVGIDANTAALTANTSALLTSAAAGGAGGGGGFLGDALGIGASLVGFATGTSYVPNNMVAQIHKGEMIIPAGPAEAIRQGNLSTYGGSSTPAVHFHVSSMDAGGVASTLKTHSAAISDAILSASRGGRNSLRTAFARM